MSEKRSESSENDKRNIHPAASEEACEKMGKKYGWELIEAKQTERDILPVDCVFEGEQTSFWDFWNDHQE
jgi:hypothetical protein